MTTMDKLFSGYQNRLATLQGNTANPWTRGIAWVEGSYYTLHAARIPLMDQGFLRSDLTYDVPAVWDGRFFRLDDHLTRIEESCVKLRLYLPLPRNQMRQTLIDMVARSAIKDAYVMIIITRGLKGIRGSIPSELVSNLYMFIQPYVWVMPPDVQKVGGSAVIARTVRRISPGSIDPTVKNLQWGDLTRGMFEAMDRDAQHPFLTDGDTNLTEGSGFNIVLVKDGVLYTPQRGVLEGVTRRSVMDVAGKEGLEIRVELVPAEMAYRCDEIFMCTTAGGIMPITSLDGKPVGDGKIGLVTKRIWNGYWRLHYDEQYSFEVEYKDTSYGGGRVAPKL